MTRKIDGLILAGGRSRRMGYKDKKDLETREKKDSFLEKIKNELRENRSIEKIYISLNKKQGYKEKEEVIVDKFHDLGPLGGIYSCLEKIETEYFFLVPCDLPNFKKEILTYMETFVDGNYDGYVLVDRKKQIHPLVGIYNSKVKRIIGKMLEEKEYKVMNFIKKLKIKYISLEFTVFEDEILKNVNTISQYKNYLEGKKIPFLCISGVKNSGKTTFIVKLIKELSKKGLKIGTIKHDGHNFTMDNIGSDTYQHMEGGSKQSLIYSSEKMVLLRREGEKELETYLNYFNGFDLVIVEGLKGKNYPKIEIIRDGNSANPVANMENLFFYLTNIKEMLKEKEINGKKIFNLDDIVKVSEEILKRIKE